MATQLFLRQAPSDLQGAGQKALSLVRGAAASTAITTTTASGNNLNVTQTAGGQALSWMSFPLGAGVTISGAVTVNIRGLESVATANAGAGVRIERCDASGTVLSTIVANSAVTATEYGTTETAQNASLTPTSTAVAAGERIKVTVLVTAAGGTMAAGTSTFFYDGPTSAASGDSFVTFNENLTFQTFVPPTTVGTAEQLAPGTGARSFTAITPNQGDWFLVQLDVEAGGTDFVCSATGLTFQLVNQVFDASNQANHNELYQWVAREPTGGIARTVNITGGLSKRYTARRTVLRGSRGPGASRGSFNTQSASFSRAYSDSRVQYNVGDWFAGDLGASEVWTPSGPVTAYRIQDNGAATHFYATWDDTGPAAPPALHGLSSPVYTTPSVAILEMYGAPAAGGGTTRVKATLDLRWRSAVRVAATVDLRWRAATRTRSSLDLRWLSYTRTSTVTDLRWRAFTRVKQTVDLRWQVLTRAKSTLNLQWRAATRVKKTLDLRWLAYTAASKILDLRWLTYTPASTTLDLQWLSDGPVNRVKSQLDLRWQVAARVKKTLDLRWLTYAAGKTTVNLQWLTYARLSRSLDLRWRSSTQGTATLDLRWIVSSQTIAAKQTLDLRWRTSTRVKVQLDLRWQSASRARRTLQLLWLSGTLEPVDPAEGSFIVEIGTRLGVVDLVFEEPASEILPTFTADRRDAPVFVVDRQ